MTTNKSFATSLWDFFCSLKLSISLLIGLAVTSIIGTVIPQGPPPPEYLQTISETKFLLYQKLGFFDMYHSWWFITLLYLLTLNLIACSIKRLPRVWKIISEPTLVMDSGLERSLTCTRQFRMPGDAATLRDRMAEFLKAEFSEPVVTETEGEFHLFAQKGAYSRLGVYVVHASIIFIFIGAIIGSLFGYKAFVSIVEGTGTSTAYNTRTEQPIELGFTVKCEDFSVSYYDTGAPKEFKSILTVIDNGKPVIEHRPTIVNDPLSYKGITFYQSSYGPAGDPIFYLSVRKRAGGEPLKVTARQGERVPLPTGGFVRVMDYAPEVRSAMPQFSGPAARLEIVPPAGSPQYALVLKDYPDFDAQRGGELIFTYEGVDEKQYTGLQVAKDPGVWVVWTGCTLMVLGIFIAFFMSHRRIWIRVSKGEVTFAGTANRNQPAFQLRFDTLADKLKQM